MWWIYALLSAVFAALTAVFVKVGVKDMDSDLGTAIRTVVILILSWAIVGAKGSIKTMDTLTSQNWIFLILSGCATGLSWIFYFRAIQLGKVSQVAPIDKLSIAFVVILAAMFLGEPMTPKIIVGVSLILLGALMLIL